MIIDVSKFQGEIDWEAVKASGVEGAILRAVSTNSAGLYKDPYFDRNYSECKRLGIPVGAYYYTYATTKDYADRELSLFRSCIEGRKFELPIVLDVEDKLLTKISASALTDLAVYALGMIEKWGCYAMWYTDLNFRKNHLDASRLASYDYWVAYWSTNKPSVPYGIWQYTSDGTVKGIKGRVDLNRTDRDYPSIIKKAGLNGFDKPEEPVVDPEPVPDPDDEGFSDDEKNIIVRIIRFLIKLIGGLE